MAEWLYQIHRVELPPATDLDTELEGILATYGAQGWELVQVLPLHQPEGHTAYRLIFKSEKTLD